MIRRLRTSTRNTLLVFLAAHLFTARSSAHALPERQLGTNLTEVVDYSHQLPFTDIFKFSREWLTQCRSDIDPGCTSSNSFDTEESSQIDLDASGWVRSLPAPSDPVLFTRVATFWDVPTDFPAGTYVVLYDGEGTLEYELGARKIIALSTPGRDVVEVTPALGGILLRIANTNPIDYLRNIRMGLLSDEQILASQTFRPQFLNRLEPYKALRFMDWMRTNNSQVTSWESRSLPTDARYSTAKGVPPEVIIHLCNATQKAPWFTIPHQATDSYVSSFASLAKSLLVPTLPIYIEYSNEAWNSAFSQGTFMERQGQLAWPDSSESGFTKRINWYGKRSAEVCKIWKAIFSDDPSRVVCVIASQAANSWTAEQALTCPLWDERPCVNHGVSALAIAPYIGDYLGQEDSLYAVSSWTTQSDGGLGKLFSELLSGDELPGGPNNGAQAQSFGWIVENRFVAQNYNLTLLAYEGGQHLVGVGSALDSAALTSLFTSANRDPRMGELYTSLLEGWNNRGGELFMHFTDISSYSKFGSWGALEVTTQTSSPKYDALKQYVHGTTTATPSPSAPPSPTTPPLATATPTATATSSPQPSPQQQDTTLLVRHRGAGRVTSFPSGIACPAGCRASFTQGARVKLRATPRRGSVFIRWRGACRTSERICTVNMTQDQRVGALFARRQRIHALADHTLFRRHAAHDILSQ